ETFINILFFYLSMRGLETVEEFHAIFEKYEGSLTHIVPVHAGLTRHHLSYGLDPNPAHRFPEELREAGYDPLHVKRILLAIYLNNTSLGENPLGEEGSDQAARDSALGKRIIEELPDKILINPGIHTAALAEFPDTFIPFAYDIRFKSPLILEEGKTTGVERIIREVLYRDNVVQYQVDFRAEDPVLGEKVTLLTLLAEGSMGLSFSDDLKISENSPLARKIREKAVKPEEGKSFRRSEIVGHKRLGLFYRSVDEYEPLRSDEGVSFYPIELLNLLPRNLIEMKEEISDHNLSLDEMAGSARRREEIRRELIDAYVEMECLQGVLEQDKARERTSELERASFMIYRGQTALVCGWPIEIPANGEAIIDIDASMVRINPVLGTSSWTQSFSSRGEKPHLIGRSEVGEVRLYTIPVLRYALNNKINLRTLKPF
ncbi:hypothetical protein D6745_05145, partial [Candidatus Woesearchaeota archaeon]